MKKTVYAGTYTGSGSEGIYAFSFEEGNLSDVRLFARAENPKYICKTRGGLLAAADYGDRSGAGFYGQKGQLIAKACYEERTSCYIGQNGDQVYTANYHTGTFSLLHKSEGELKFVRTVTIQDGAGCHEVLCHQDLVLVPCLFLDRIMVYDRSLNRVGSIKFDHGTGPRHGVFTKDGTYLYLVSELSNELFVIRTDTWDIIDRIPVLADGRTHVRGTAAVRMNQNEDRIYVSTRGEDVISVIRMEDHKPELMENVSCGGKHPRDFILIDQWLLCANRYSNEVVSFSLHEDGTIGEICSRISIPEPVSLAV